MKEKQGRKPAWLKARSMSGEQYEQVRSVLRTCGVNTVCDEALCPNRGACFNENTATFMILGRVCTRGCAFCNVTKGAPEPVSHDEPQRIAEAVGKLGLDYVVITSVTRDDLPGGGADHFARTIEAIKHENPGTAVEVLIPDFKGDPVALERVAEARPEVIGHNVETVPALYGTVRPGADYLRSLDLIGRIKGLPGSPLSKTGIMVGLGESRDEVLGVMDDLRERDCQLLTIGQYLSPGKDHLPVAEYIHPDVFEQYHTDALERGFLFVASAPFVRSSYLAHRAYRQINDEKPCVGN